VKATEVTAGLAESNGSLLPGLWRDSLQVTCGLTACTPGSAPGPTLGNEYRKTLPFIQQLVFAVCSVVSALATWLPDYLHTSSPVLEHPDRVIQLKDTHRYVCSSHS